jgi:hypothetical protein
MKVGGTNAKARDLDRLASQVAALKEHTVRIGETKIEREDRAAGQVWWIISANCIAAACALLFLARRRG